MIQCIRTIFPLKFGLRLPDCNLELGIRTSQTIGLRVLSIVAKSDSAQIVMKILKWLDDYNRSPIKHLIFNNDMHSIVIVTQHRSHLQLALTKDFSSFLKNGFQPKLSTALYTSPLSTFAQPK